jgi:hypothetical protein
VARPDEAGEVGIVAHVVVRARGRTGGAPDARAAGRGFALLQQYQMLRLVRIAGRRGQARHLVRRARGIGQQQGAVALAQAALAPVRIVVADVDQMRAARLARTEPARFAVTRLGLVDDREFGLDSERGAQPASETVQVDAAGRAEQGDAVRMRADAVLAGEAPQRDPRHAHHRLRVHRDQTLERGARQAQQFAVAQRHDAGAARIAGDQSGLAHAFARRHRAERAHAALVVAPMRRETSVHQQVERVGRIVLREQGRAAGQHHPFHRVGEIAEGVRVEAGEQRQRGEAPQQVASCGVVALHAGSPGRNRAHYAPRARRLNSDRARATLGG